MFEQCKNVHIKKLAIHYSGKVKECIYNAKGGQEDAAIFEYCVKGH